MGLLDQVLAVSGAVPGDVPPGHVITEWTASAASRNETSYGKSRPPVGNSPDLERILALVRRPPVDLEKDLATSRALIDLMGERLGRKNDNCKCAAMGRPCIRELKAVQAWALYEAPQADGLIAPVAVGAGKTFLDILTALVFSDCKVAVLLVPPNLQSQLRRDYEAVAQHFHVPSLVMGYFKMPPTMTGWQRDPIQAGRPVLHVIPFSMFSRAGSTDLLEQLQPDLILVDEAHKLRHLATATTARVQRYFVKHPETRLCAWSGTFTAKSIRDYAHLCAWALGLQSPLPLRQPVVDEWALAIDPPLAGNTFPAPAGALTKLGQPDEALYEAFRRRFIETKGVVSTVASAIDASIYIDERPAPEMPKEVKGLLTTLRGEEVRPDGEQLIDKFQVARCARELSCGFFYRWRFPHGASDGKTKFVKCMCEASKKHGDRPPLCEPCQEEIAKWFSVRKAYNKELRQQLKYPIEHMDSPLLCWKAAERAHAETRYDGDLPVWRSEIWPEWVKWHDRIYHESEAVWVDDFLARDAAAWAKENRGIVWYEHEAFGRRVAELSGLNLHGGGPNAGERIAKENGKKSIIVSIKAHGTGRDGLQRIFNDQLVTNPPSSGDAWEQLIGRTHRHGQPEDEVFVKVYRHTPEMSEALDSAVLQAKYIEGTMGTMQKLLNATVSFEIGR